MAVYDNELKTEYEQDVAVEQSYETLDEAISKALERIDEVVSVWQAGQKYYVLPFGKWIDAERLDFECVADMLKLKELNKK